MGSRKIIKQVQVPAETTGNLYTLTVYDDGTIGCPCSSGVRQGPLLGTSDKLCEHLISFRCPPPPLALFHIQADSLAQKLADGTVFILDHLTQLTRHRQTMARFLLSPHPW